MPKSDCRMYCAVFGCMVSSISHPDITFFRLPGKSERRLQWLQMIRRDDLKDKNFASYRVCEKHFSAEDILQSSMRKLLKKNALPLMMLPGTVPGDPRKQEKQTQTVQTARDENSPGASNDPLDPELKETSIASTCSSPEPQLSSQSSSSNHMYCKRKVDDNLDEIYDIEKSAKRKMDEFKDEFDIYGQYVASELRETKDEHSILKAKALINNILFEMRMGKYRNDDIVPVKIE